MEKLARAWPHGFHRSNASFCEDIRDPGWYSRASKSVLEPVVDMQTDHKVEPIITNGNSFTETKTIGSEDRSMVETQDKDVVSEGLGFIAVYDQWIRPPISGKCLKAQYEHGATVIQDKMYVYGENHNGRYLNDLHGLSLVVSSYNGEDILVSFGGYNRHYNNEVNVLKPSHKSTLQSKIMATPVPDSVSAVHNVTNPTKDLESKLEVDQDGKIREIIVDNVDPESMVKSPVNNF